MSIAFSENGIYLHIETDGGVRLMNLSRREYAPQEGLRWFRLIELQETGFHQNDHHGPKHTGTSPGDMLDYVSHRDYTNAFGRKLEVEMRHEVLNAVYHLQFYDGISVVRSWAELENRSDEIRSIEYVSSFALTGTPNGPETTLLSTWRTIHGTASANGKAIRRASLGITPSTIFP